MPDLSTEVNSDWITIKEAAKLLGVSVNAVHQSLIRYPEIKETYAKRAGHGKTGALLFHRAGMTLLVANQDTARNRLVSLDSQGKKHAKGEIIKKGVESMGQIALLAKEVAELKAMIQAQPKPLALQSPGLILPAPIEEVPELTKGDEIRRRITLYLAERHGESSGQHFKKAWNRLYQELYWRYSISVNARKREGESGLDVCERLGAMDKLYALACYLFPTSNDSL